MLSGSVTPVEACLLRWFGCGSIPMVYARCVLLFILYSFGSRLLLHLLYSCNSTLLRLLPWFSVPLLRRTPSPRPGATDLMSLITPALERSITYLVPCTWQMHVLTTLFGIDVRNDWVSLNSTCYFAGTCSLHIIFAALVRPPLPAPP